MTAPHPDASANAVMVTPQGEPLLHDALSQAVVRAGAVITDNPAEATALIWANPFQTETFSDVLAAAPDLRWVQLPFAGIGPYLKPLRADPRPLVVTCGKGVYATPVAEHALTLALGGLRHLHRFIGTSTWGDRTGENLLGRNVTVLGGGGIAREFIRLLAPFGCDVTVIRRSSEPVDGANRTLGMSRALEVLPRTDVLVVAWALTAETTRWVDEMVFAALPEHAWLINVARGAHVDHDALAAALASGTIGGAGLDVTDPEPLPDGHPLWAEPNCIITPHVGNTAEMGRPLLARRVFENTTAFLAGGELTGHVDLDAGY